MSSITSVKIYPDKSKHRTQLMNNMGKQFIWKFKILKILNFRNWKLKPCSMPTKLNNFKFKWLVDFRQSENKSGQLF